MGGGGGVLSSGVCFDVFKYFIKFNPEIDREKKKIKTTLTFSVPVLLNHGPW